MRQELDFGEVKETVAERKARLEREAAEEVRERRKHLASLSLLNFIKELSPDFDRPDHMADWCSMIERVLTEPVRGICALPIRHYKTWTTLHGVAWLLVKCPTLRIILMCADHERATELGKMCRRLCEAAGIGPTRGDNIIVDWKNDEGGGVVCMSAEQSKLGRDVDVLIFDDPITELTAEDPMVRDAVDKSIAHYTARCQRKGARGSVLGVMSPWHIDDPLGRRKLRKAVHWEIVTHPAIGPDGKAFAPSVIDVPGLMKIRDELREQDPSERLWWAQFMCEPRAQVDARFGEPLRYDTLPAWPGFKGGMGVDLAYTPGEGDWFACVVVKIYGPIAYVVDVVRERADFNVLENLIRNRWDAYGRCPIFSYIAGPEKGAIRYFTDRGIPIHGLPARYNKATRAQKTIDRWNAGKVQLPIHAPWVPGFLMRARQFTGSDKARDDDEVDALVSVLDGMMGSDAGGMPRAFGKPRV